MRLRILRFGSLTLGQTCKHIYHTKNVNVKTKKDVVNGLFNISRHFCDHTLHQIRYYVVVATSLIYASWWVGRFPNMVRIHCFALRSNYYILRFPHIKNLRVHDLGLGI